MYRQAPRAHLATTSVLNHLKIFPKETMKTLLYLGHNARRRYVIFRSGVTIRSCYNIFTEYFSRNDENLIISGANAFFLLNTKLL